MTRQVRLYIKGDVIGVGFRAWTKIQAKMLGVYGWVKNVYDRDDIYGPRGGVETLIQGEDKIIEEMIKKVREGSPISRVDDVEVIEETPKETFSDFKIIK